MSFNQLGKLFPSKSSFLVFWVYVILFTNHGLLVTGSQTASNQYEYNVVTVVLLTEVFKLIASIGLYLKDNNITSLGTDITKNNNVLLRYFIPAFLYCLYNNLAYQNLLAFDPTTYNLLLQFRIFITAILFQVLFKRKLSTKQWISLLILTIGCMLKQIPLGNEEPPMKGKQYGLDMPSLTFIFLQIICSCLAGVYNEYLLKNEGADVDIFIQNIFMYLDSIICNIIVLIFQGELRDAFSSDNISKVLHFQIMIIMINNATVGIITSFFLKQLNSILKTFAAAVELILTATLAFIIFHTPIYLNTVLSLITVSFAIYLYTQNPVKGQEERKRVEESEELLMDEVLVKE